MASVELLSSRQVGIQEPRAARILLIAFTVGFLGLFLVLPLAIVFEHAFSAGVRAYWSAVSDPLTLSAMRLTVLASTSAVLCNAVFGIALAWLVTHFRFRGRQVLMTMMDIPLAVSPVVAGMVFVLLLGHHGWFGPWLDAWNVRVIFATPGIILCTVFVTVPFVARELIPVMEERGATEEEAALVLGASGWQTLRLVTLPAIKWALLYGLVLCNARAMGEFGAVSVVSGHIRGRTNTLPLHIEILYNEYEFAAAFAVSSLLALSALVTLGIKRVVELRHLRGVRGGSAGGL
jgi:sulfate transport system permease protein